MAQIIEFRLEPGRAPPPTNEPVGRVLLFTGVRYERMREPDPAPELAPETDRPRGGGKKRRRG